MKISGKKTLNKYNYKVSRLEMDLSKLNLLNIQALVYQELGYFLYVNVRISDGLKRSIRSWGGTGSHVQDDWIQLLN